MLGKIVAGGWHRGLYCSMFEVHRSLGLWSDEDDGGLIWLRVGLYSSRAAGQLPTRKDVLAWIQVKSNRKLARSRRCL